MAAPFARALGAEPSAATRLALRAGLFWLVMSGAYALLDLHFAPVALATARALAACLVALGLDAVASGITVSWQSGSFVIIPECTGIFGYSILAAFVLASPTGWRARILGLAVGAVAVALCNMARLVLLALVRTHAPRFYTVAHDYLWQVLFVLALAGFYGWWLSRSVRRAGPAAPHGALPQPH
jgi:exosortase/archaeosortase family protein